MVFLSCFLIKCGVLLIIFNTPVTTQVLYTMVRKNVLVITNYETVGGGLSPDLPHGLTAIEG